MVEKKDTTENVENVEEVVKGAYVINKSFGYKGFIATAGETVEVPADIVKALGKIKDKDGKAVYFQKA